MPRLFPAAARHDDRDVLAFDVTQLAQTFAQVTQARLQVGDAEGADFADAGRLGAARGRGEAQRSQCKHRVPPVHGMKCPCRMYRYWNKFAMELAPSNGFPKKCSQIAPNPSQPEAALALRLTGSGLQHNFLTKQHRLRSLLPQKRAEPAASSVWKAPRWRCAGTTGSVGIGGSGP